MEDKHVIMNVGSITIYSETSLSIQSWAMLRRGLFLGFGLTGAAGGTGIHE